MRNICSFGILIFIILRATCLNSQDLTKVDPSVLQVLSEEGKSEVLVLFKNESDFTTENNIRGKNRKGEYVFEKLKSRKRGNRYEIIDFLEEYNTEYKEYHIVNAVLVRVDEFLIKKLCTYEAVERIVADEKFEYIAPIIEKTNHSRTIEWGITKINAPDVWDMGYKGDGVVIGGQDTGYEWDHEALKEMYRGWDGTSAEHDYNWHDAIHAAGGSNPCGSDSPFPCDDHNHGTHTMGTMVGDDGMGKQIGVAPEAKWMGCRNMDQGHGTLSTYLECFEWFLAPYAIGDDPEDGDPTKAPHVINNSWACPPSEGCNSSNFEIMREAIENLKNAGIFVAVSAGNSGSSCNTVSNPPAIFEESFSVGSTTSSDVISGFSSRGPVTVDGSNRLKPNVSAPGSSVYSCIRGGGYATYSGTSMAGPHVAGAVALIISANPDIAGEVDLIEDILEQTAVQLVTGQSCGGLDGDDIPNNTYGYGRIDVLAAVNRVLEENHVPIIKIDHFGYRTNDKKVAVLSNPITGYNDSDSYTPSTMVNLKDANTHNTIFSAAPISWNGGATHIASGDQVWRFDFSSVTTPGVYYVADGTTRSEDFEINDDVYHGILDVALKTFYYQRCGVEKESSVVGDGFSDPVCHSQDINCKFINDPTNPALEKDMSGGWHDAGDYNKYVNFAGGTLLDLLLAYEMNQESWSDQIGIPESGNGIPDILDEIKIELDWLIKMQDSDGGAHCVVGVENYASASPPSADLADRFYGPKTTSASFTVAAVFALAAKQARKINNATWQNYADDLESKAEDAWTWGIDNPSQTYYNAGIIAAGEQEMDTYNLDMTKLIAAVYLYSLTGNAAYKSYVESNYNSSHMMSWGFVYPFENKIQLALLYYAHLDGVTASVSSTIISTFKTSMDTSGDNIPSFTNDNDAYLAFISDANYVWGSNKVKSDMGILYQTYRHYDLDVTVDEDLYDYSQAYLHYLHGVNPNGYSYLSNMLNFGSSKSCRSIYHGWFEDGSAAWDDAYVSDYGPAPGFVTGGANPNWSLDGCCPSGCGASNTLCVVLEPPSSQPIMKSYLDWNTGWPQNSWEITEPAIYYQSSYLFLLSAFTNQNNKLGDGHAAVIIKDKDLVFETIGKSIVLQSDSGIKYRIRVDNSGNIYTELVNTLSPDLTKVVNGSLVIDDSDYGLVIASPDFNLWRLGVDKSANIMMIDITDPGLSVDNHDGDILIDIFPNGLILRDKENVCYQITVDDAGSLYCNASKCGE